MAEHRNPALKSGVSYLFSLITIEEFMKIYTTNAVSFLSRWTHFVGVSRKAGLTAVLPLFLLIAGCKKEDTVVGPTPIVIPLQTTVQATVNLQSTAGFVILAGNLGGLTLTPGLYKSSGSLEISSGNLTFDAKGDANAVL
ncbi:MAG: ice-binding family protein [Bacteroidales bacterium]|nr:ice-binding family protein [Bacteroidales bacterium]